MKNSTVIFILFFLKEEIKIQINKIKFLYHFVREFSILRFLCYLVDNSVIPSRDKIFREYILKNSQKWKLRKEPINKNTSKYVLITNIVNHLGYTISEIIIGKNLMEMFESDGMALLKKHDLRSKLIFESFGIKKFIFLDDLNFIMRIKYFLQAYSIIKSCKTMDNFIKFRLNDVRIGGAVYDHFLRFTGIGTSNHFHHKFYTFLSQALSIYYQMKKNYDKFKFIACVQSERQFIPGSIIYQSSLIKGINVYSRSGFSNTFSIRKYSDVREMWKNRERYSKKLFDQISNSIKEKAVEIGGNNIEKRFNGIPEYDVFHDYFEDQKLMKRKKYQKREKKNITKKELCEQLGWDQNKPIVAILATDLTDGVFDNTWSLFKDRLTWLTETLCEIRNIKNINWLIKPHPNDELNKVVTDTMSVYKKICSNYKHILPFPNSTSVASIPKFVNAIITSGGSASYEYPSLGIPVFQGCESICSGRGFTIDPALIYAFMHQESTFNTTAKSSQGAIGLMQIMPATAKFISTNKQVKRNNSNILKIPEINLEVGQEYIKYLMNLDLIQKNLIYLAAAYNGGPGNLKKWQDNTNYFDDPLLFMESIPSRETRWFIEKVLTKYWIYNNKLNNKTNSLEMLAKGDNPIY